MKEKRDKKLQTYSRVLICKTDVLRRTKMKRFWIIMLVSIFLLVGYNVCAFDTVANELEDPGYISSSFLKL